MKAERRGFFLVVAVLLLSALLGGIYGPNVRATTASADDYQSSVHDFTRVLDVVQANYAETVDVDKAVYQGAIPGMLRMLDPHSNFPCCARISAENITASAWWSHRETITPWLWLPMLALRPTTPESAPATSS